MKVSVFVNIEVKFYLIFKKIFCIAILSNNLNGDIPTNFSQDDLRFSAVKRRHLNQTDSNPIQDKQSKIGLNIQI